MRPTYPDYFEKQKTTDTLPYGTREAHFETTQISSSYKWRYTHTSRYMSVYFWSTVVEIFAMH